MIRIICIFLITMNSFAGAHFVNENLPDLDLTSGQKMMIEYHVKKFDKKEETEYIKVEFLCKKKKKKTRLLDSKIKCKLVELN